MHSLQILGTSKIMGILGVFLCKGGKGMEEEKSRVNMWISNKILMAIEQIRKDTGRSTVDLVRDALWRYVKQYEIDNKIELLKGGK